MPKSRCQRYGWAPRQGLAIQPAAGFYEIDISPGDAKISATVSHLRPYGECRGHVTWRHAPWRQADQHPAVRAPFQPDECLTIAVPGDLRQAQPFGETLGPDRAGPEAILHRLLRLCHGPPSA